MARLSLSALGPLQITLDGRPVTGFESTKVIALLVYLAVEADRAHRRESLAGLLWPDFPDTAARDNLRQALSNLRQTIGDRTAEPPFLLIDRQTVQFNLASDHASDVATFTALIAACERHAHPHAERCEPCNVRLEEAVALYHGDFLAQLFVEDSIPIEEWVLLKREWLHQQAVEALARLANYHERRGDYARARSFARRQLQLEPWREEAHRQLMRLLVRAGQRSAAIAQYEACRRILADEFGVEPSPETAALYERLRTPRALPGRVLPRYPTSFVGRREEQAIIAYQLTVAGCQLVTIVGPGGIGKTRLAIEVCASLLDDFDGAVYFVTLASARDPDSVLPAIAQTLGIKEVPGEPLATSVRTFLRDKHLLLLLDNFEPVIAAAPQVAELLQAAPGVKALVTSREALHLYGEQEFPLSPLALPDLRGLPSEEPDLLSALSWYSAIELFVDRALLVQPDFKLTRENAAAVAEICIGLDGLPLAIELAAARVKLFPPPAMLTRLENRLTWLTGGARDVPARQQTLRATIDWSYSLLDSDEQTLFSQLAVFAGGCTLEAAAAVVGSIVLDGLASLVEKSLLRRVEGVEGEPRFLMLETIREYAWERLVAAQEAETVRRQHAGYYLALAEAAAPELARARQEAWLDRLEQEHGNLRVALELALADGEVEIAARFGAALYRFWWVRGHLSEGRVWVDWVLALVTADARSPLAAPLQADVLHAAATLCWAQGDFARAAPLLEESLAMAEQLGDRPRIARELSSLGIVASEQGDFPRAVQLLEESLALDEALGNTHGVAVSLASLAAIAYFRGQYEQARRFYTRSLAVFREEEDQHSIAIALLNLGDVARKQGDDEHVAAFFEESLVLFRELESKTGTAHALYNLGNMALDQGRVEPARAFYGEALRLFGDLGHAQDVATVLVGFAALEMAHGLPERVARLLGAVEATCEATGVRLNPPDQADYDRMVAAIRSQLGEEAFEAAWAEARTMTWEQAIVYAL